MPDTPAPSLVETVARSMYRSLDADPRFVNRADLTCEHPAWEQYCWQARAAINTVLDAIAEPSDAMGHAGLIATNGDSLEGWPDEHRRAALEALGDIGLSDRIAGNPSKWMKPIWRAMFSVLRKGIDNA